MENLTGCSQCKGGGRLIGTGEKSCLPPECKEGEYYDLNWICMMNPTDCNIAENITGRCMRARDGFYLDDNSKVKSCRIKDEFCSICSDLTGECQICEKGRLY